MVFANCLHTGLRMKTGNATNITDGLAETVRLTLLQQAGPRDSNIATRSSGLDGPTVNPKLSGFRVAMPGAYLPSRDRITMCAPSRPSRALCPPR